MLNFLAFLFALTLLVSVHEWGHYRVAVALGVRVLRFSVGLGRPVWRWRQPDQKQGHSTEFSIGWLPLGGFVSMLDESMGPVDAKSVHQAFNRQPLWARSLIVAAGPLANFVLAVMLLSAAAWWGNRSRWPSYRRQCLILLPTRRVCEGESTLWPPGRSMKTPWF